MLQLSRVLKRFALTLVLGTTALSFAGGNKNSPPPPWEELPEELLTITFRFLEPRELKGCLLVNKLWRKLACPVIKSGQLEQTKPAVDSLYQEIKTPQRSGFLESALFHTLCKLLDTIHSGELPKESREEVGQVYLKAYCERLLEKGYEVAFNLPVDTPNIDQPSLSLRGLPQIPEERKELLKSKISPENQPNYLLHTIKMLTWLDKEVYLSYSNWLKYGNNFLGHRKSDREGERQRRTLIFVYHLYTNLPLNENMKLLPKKLQLNFLTALIIKKTIQDQFPIEVFQEFRKRYLKDDNDLEFTRELLKSEYDEEQQIPFLKTLDEPYIGFDEMNLDELTEEAEMAFRGLLSPPKDNRCLVQ